MRATLVSVFLALSTSAASAASPVRLGATDHVRPLGAPAAVLLAEATDRSPVVRQLLEELAHTDLVVYVENPMETSGHSAPAHLAFLSAGGGTRYLLVRVARWGVAPWEQIARLAHELQHAIEIARAPDVRDTAGMAALYRRIGWEAGRGRFESEEALATGNLVRRELTRFSSRRRPAMAAASAASRGCDPSAAGSAACPPPF